MKTYNEFLNEKFDYTKQKHNEIKKIKPISDLQQNDDIFIIKFYLIGNDIKFDNVIYYETVKSIGFDIICTKEKSEYFYQIKFKESKYNHNSRISYAYKTGSNGYFVISTDSNLINKFLESKQIKEFCKNAINKNNLQINPKISGDLFDEFLNNY